MVLFPAWFVIALIYGSVVLASLGMFLLLALLVKEWREGQIW